MMEEYKRHGYLILQGRQRCVPLAKASVGALIKSSDLQIIKNKFLCLLRQQLSPSAIHLLYSISLEAG